MGESKTQLSKAAEISPVISSQSVKYSFSPEFILLISPPKTEAFPGKPELGQELDGADSLFEVETVPFLVLSPIRKMQK